MSFAPLEEQTRKILFITIGLQIIKQECKAKLFLTIFMIFLLLFFLFVCVEGWDKKILAAKCVRVMCFGIIKLNYVSFIEF